MCRKETRALQPTLWSSGVRSCFRPWQTTPEASCYTQLRKLKGESTGVSIHHERSTATHETQITRGGEWKIMIIAEGKTGVVLAFMNIQLCATFTWIYCSCAGRWLSWDVLLLCDCVGLFGQPWTVCHSSDCAPRGHYMLTSNAFCCILVR